MEDSDIALVLAITSDERKAARLQEIMRAEKSIIEREADITNQRAGLERDRAQLTHDYAEFILQRGELESEKAAVTKMAQGIAAEKQAWEKIRQETDAQQVAQTRRLELREEAVAVREQLIEEREERARDRHVAAEALRTEYDAKHQRLHDALAANRPSV